jgi:hypothetical protein
MKRILLTPVLYLAITLVANGQSPSRGEFATNTNGLMYNDADMKVLRFVVDSLNLRFKSCDLSKEYYSYPQTKQYYIRFKSTENDLTDIIKDLERNIGFDQLISKYNSFIDNVDSGKLFIRSVNNIARENNSYIEGTPGTGYGDAGIDKKSNILINRWIYDYSSKNQYSKHYSLSCRYFPVQWKQQIIPEKYARLIQYVDCMIDTSAVVFLADNYSGGWFRNENEKAGYYNLKAVADYLDKQKGEQNKNQKLKQLSEQQLRFASEKLKEDAEFKTIVSKTIDDYVQNKTANFQLEQLASDLRLFDKALLMKRCYRIMGSCSQDTRPREHARDIAILAAQSHSWDIFLRAHLDIMNDRFERASDGSYAWNERKTYLKELEELNLNIVDLMLGLTLRAQNVADNHYYGTIWRMGWALTESKEKNVFEEKAIAMMKDESLDEFNRGLVFLLYKTYTSYLNETEGKLKRDVLRNNISSFPGFIQASIKQLEEPKSKRR